MKSTSTAKYQHVRAQLEAAIRSREFAVGEQFPPEQAIADRFGVSYLTARRAVCELVEADLLERRARKGTFVRPHRAPQTTTTLSLVTSSYDHSLMREFISQGSQIAEQYGWKSNVIRLSAGQQDAAVRAINNGDLALVLLDEIAAHSSLAHAMRAAKGKAICLGSPTTDAGVSCIFSNADQMFQVAADYILSAGHQDVVFIGQSTSDSVNEIHTQAWYKATSGIFSQADAAARFLHVKTPLFQCPTHDAYDATRRFLAEGILNVTAFVSFGEEITQGVLAAIRNSGKAVPNDISVINILDGPSMAFAHPPVTSVDIDMERHFKIGFELLEAAQNGALPAPKNHFVAPRIIERQSVHRL